VKINMMSHQMKTKFFELFQFSVSTMQGCMKKNFAKCTKKKKLKPFKAK